MRMSEQMSMSKEMSMSGRHGGHLYMQTNEIRNAIIHYITCPNSRQQAMYLMPVRSDNLSLGAACSGRRSPIQIQSAVSGIAGFDVHLTPGSPGRG